MRSSLPKILALVMALGLVAVACGDDDSADSQADPAPASDATDSDGTDSESTDDAAEPMVDDDIVTVATETGQFPTLVAAVEAAGLVDTLQGEGPFTVFAPTEDAFAALLADLGITADDLLADTELLRSVLTYHVVPGDNRAADVVGLAGSDVETVNGATAAITVDGGTVMVNDAEVVTTDVLASNGVIHVIDTVLVP